MIRQSQQQVLIYVIYPDNQILTRPFYLSNIFLPFLGFGCRSFRREHPPSVHASVDSTPCNRRKSCRRGTPIRFILTTGVLSSPLLEQIVRQVRQSLSYLDKLDMETREIVRSAYGSAIQSTLILTMSFVLTAIVVSLFIIERPLPR